MEKTHKEAETVENVFEGIELGLMSETAKIKFVEGPLRFEILSHPKYKAVIEACRGILIILIISHYFIHVFDHLF